MAARDFFLGGVLPGPEVPLVDIKTGLVIPEWRWRFEAEHTALFGEDGSTDVTADIPTGSYVGSVTGDTPKGLTVSGTPAPGYAVTITLAQDIRTTAAPVFAAISIGGNITVGGTVDGRDIATDGTKLDGIEAGATADQTATEIRSLLLGVDGAGSGVDADLLDGQQGSYYLARANHTGAQAISTVTGLQTALDGKAAAVHAHAIADVTGLQTALDGKAATSHTHSTSDITGLDAALASKVSKTTGITDASTSHAVTDFATTNAALDALGAKINEIIDALNA